MKKVILSSALILATGIFFVSCKEKNGKTIETNTPKIQTTMSEAEKAQMDASEFTKQEDGFTETTPDKASRILIEALMRDFPTADISKVSINDDNLIKLEGSFGDGSVAKLYGDRNGNWYEMNTEGNLVKK
jgi:hypothetical protein